MNRPLKAYEPIKSFTAKADLAATDAQTTENALPLQVSSNTSLVINVAEEGVYQVKGQLCYDRNGQAQSTCSVHLNGKFSQSLSVNGTVGKTIDVDGLAVRLSKSPNSGSGLLFFRIKSMSKRASFTF